MTQAPDTAGVIVRPPFLFLGSLLAGIALDWLRPLPVGAPAPLLRALVAAALVGSGAAMMAVAIRQFARAGTNVPTWMPTQALVADGLYGWSRNPIYVAMIAIYLGLTVAAWSAWAAVLLPVAWAVLRWGVVAREERYLTRRFGNAYGDYCRRVRRWL